MGRLQALGDVPPELVRAQLHQVAEWIADYREGIANLPITSAVEPGAIKNSLAASAPEQGESFDEIWQDFRQIILPGIVHWGHPQFTAYFGSTTTAPGILAEAIAAALNVNAMTWRASPAATELETVVLDWLRQWLGLPSTFQGVVYDTASISTMHALAAARERIGPVRQSGLGEAGKKNFRIYASDQAHSSIEKAAIVLGLGEKSVLRVPHNREFQLDAVELRDRIRDDKKRRRTPLAVVGTVGTTSTAAVDPIAELAQICREGKIWLHLDAAYGGGLALLPENAWVKEGWSEADSIVVNPHKMLFVPFDFSCLYLKDLETLREVFTLVPEYLSGDAEGAQINYMDYGVQLGRRFRALKAWMVWRTFGREGMISRIRESLRLARLLADLVEADKRFELRAPVTMGIVCFSLADGREIELVQNVNSSGKAYLTVTRLDGRDAVRAGFGNVLTTEAHVRSLWELICSSL